MDGMLPAADPAALNRITGECVDAAVAVHMDLGPGLREPVYAQAFGIELRARGIEFRDEVSVPLRYRGVRLNGRLRVDFLVEGQVVIEVKSVERLHEVHTAQLLNYMRHTGRRVGLLLNFNAPLMRVGIRRHVL